MLTVTPWNIGRPSDRQQFEELALLRYLSEAGGRSFRAVRSDRRRIANENEWDSQRNEVCSRMIMNGICIKKSAKSDIE